MSSHRFDQATTVTCRTTTVSQLMIDERLGMIDLLKIDVEGDEMAVLEGITDADADRIHEVVMEAHDVNGRVAAITSWLKAHGFEVRVGGGDARMEKAGCFNIAAKKPSRTCPV